LSCSSCQLRSEAKMFCGSASVVMNGVFFQPPLTELIFLGLY
jgi:hypothetical protein